MKKRILFNLCVAFIFALTVHAQNVLIDFGQSKSVSEGNWNDITTIGATGDVVSLIDFDTGAESGLTLEITDGFQGMTAGGWPSSVIGDFVATAVQDGLYTSTAAPAKNGTGAIKFAGLAPDTAYEFNFIATRVASEKRSTLYTLVGAETNTTIIEPSAAGAGTASIASVYSDASGNVVLTVEKAANNQSVFSYLSGLQIKPMPESSTLSATDDTIRILGIGNSFTVDSQRYLADIIASDPSTKAEVFGAVIGGSPLDLHVKLAQEHEADPAAGKRYGYTRNARVIASKLGLKEILLSQQWDFITIQQVSTKSYKAESFYPFAEQLIDYIRQYAPKAEIVVHETWSHSIDSYRATEWKLDPDEMYAKLHANYQKIADEFGLRVLPVGTAYQNARATPMWDYQPTKVDVSQLKYPEDKENLPDESKSLNRIFSWREKDGNYHVGNDGFHASVNGRYLGGLVWYACLFEKDPRGISYKPDEVTEAQAVSLRAIARDTVLGGVE
ncbi:DUF4886 domain-containing protein [Coraliomargarita sp. W4R72]